MKIYTKTGDKGQTSLIGGKRVSKSHSRIEAYGTVDELISYIGLLRDSVKDEGVKKNMIRVQDHLMICSAVLAADLEGNPVKIPEITGEDIAFLEKGIDEMEKSLEPLYSFVLPGGHVLVSFCHIARTVCRRAERCIIRLSEEFSVPEPVIKYMNRLSDYLFVLSRKLSKDNQGEEIPWIPRL